MGWELFCLAFEKHVWSPEDEDDLLGTSEQEDLDMVIIQ